MRGSITFPNTNYEIQYCWISPGFPKKGLKIKNIDLIAHQELRQNINLQIANQK